MLQITNKTMLSTAIVLPVMNQFTIGKSSSPRKQYWRMTIPNSRVSLPDKLFTFAIFYTDNLCTMFCMSDNTMKIRMPPAMATS